MRLEHLSRNRMYHSKQVISLIKVYVAQWSALRRAHQICTSSCTRVQYKACLTRYNQRFTPGKYLRQNVAATSCQKQMNTGLQSRGLRVCEDHCGHLLLGKKRRSGGSWHSLWKRLCIVAAMSSHQVSPWKWNGHTHTHTHTHNFWTTFGQWGYPRAQSKNWKITITLSMMADWNCS